MLSSSHRQTSQKVKLPSQALQFEYAGFVFSNILSMIVKRELELKT